MRGVARTKNYADVIRKRLAADPKLSAAVECERDLMAAYQQLACLWDTTRSCPCGARKESPNTHPHVIGCPTGAAAEMFPE